MSIYGESLADIDLDCWTIISNLSAITNSCFKLRLFKLQVFPYKERYEKVYLNSDLLQHCSCTFQPIYRCKLKGIIYQSKIPIVLSFRQVGSGRYLTCLFISTSSYEIRYYAFQYAALIKYNSY